MSFTLDDLYPASFRGIPFLVMDDQNTRSGSKIIENEYPNDSRRYDENLGRLKNKYSVTGIITGDDYIINRDALAFALNDGSIGILVHPFYGEQNVVCKGFSLNENTSKLRVATFVIDFSVSDPAINPSLSGDIISEIINAANTVDTAIQNALQTAFKVSTFFPENFIAAEAKLNSISSEFNGFKSQFSTTTDTSSFDNQNKIFLQNIVTNIKTPSKLSSDLSDLFGVANNISDNPKNTGSAFVSMFNYSLIDSQVPIVPSISNQARERVLNNNILNYSFAIYTLMYAYLNYTQSTFNDDQELNQISSTLEEQYLKIINGQITQNQQVDVSTVVGNDVLDSLENIRNLTRQQFDKDNNNTSQIVSINVTNPLSVSLISYYYYGNTGQDQAIIDLNNLVDISFVKGTLNVRTQSQ